MPFGYLVNLGADNALGVDDVISDPWTDFVSAQEIGAGQWVFTGRDGGQNFNNTLEPGIYYLATDGNVYFVPTFGEVDRLDAADVVSAPAFLGTNQVDGTDAGDVINSAFTDADGDAVDDGSTASGNADSDIIYGNGGNDTINSGAGADTVFGGAGNDVINGGGGGDSLSGGSGNDSIIGGGGADVIYGVNEDDLVTENLSWDAQGADEAIITGSFTQNTGLMDVSVTVSDTGNNNAEFSIETNEINFSEPDDPFSRLSSLYVAGDGDAETGRIDISFDSADPTVGDEVQNVMFRINDIDQATGNHRDVITINATDANGNPVTVTITPTGNATVSGNTITAGNGGVSQADAQGSVLVEIAGPVKDIDIIYSNAVSGTQAIWVTDVYFDVSPATNDTLFGGAGNDSIFGQGGDDLIAGQTGADVIDGGAGNDTIDVGQGDMVTGGAGNDLFRIVDLAEAGTTGITLVGGDDSGDNDVLDLGGVADRTTLSFTTGPTGELTGSVELIDGTLLTFSGIDQIICFTPGTMIQTIAGPRTIESLSAGDMVITRDRGPQPVRWIGKRTVPATGALAPVEIDPVLISGATAPLIVSQQHRVLWEGYRAQMLFGEAEVLVAAKHLLSNPAVRLLEGGEVTYIHLLFDQHEVIYANGMPTESFYPGDMALSSLTDNGRHEMFELFPDLRSGLSAFGDTARLCLRQHEAPLLVA